MSIWNQGKYHWEEHNANEWAKARLNELVNDIKIEGWELTDPNFSSISAARTIRKGREIRQYEIIFDTKFKYNGMSGKIEFPDISEDAADSPDEWEYILSFTGSSNDKPAAEKKVVRTAAEKEVVPVFKSTFAKWVQEFKAIPYS